MLQRSILFGTCAVLATTALIVSCSDDEDSATTGTNTGGTPSTGGMGGEGAAGGSTGGGAADALQECIDIVLVSPDAYSNCFEGDGTYNACSTCGYYPVESQSQGDFDCITCELGDEIDVFFEDCTGYCVPEGTATNPIGQDPNNCQANVQCVHDLYE
jgi:hypothetical protein